MSKPVPSIRASGGAVALAQAAGPKAAPPATDLEIEEIRTWNVQEPVSHRSYTILRLRTRSGLAGFGECAAAAASDLATASQLVRGKPVTAFETVGRQLAPTPTLRAAVNMAMLDAVGRLTGTPLFQVLGGPTRFKARAMTRLEGDSEAELLSSMKAAQAAGFMAFSVPVPRVTARNQGQAFVLATRRRLDALRDAAGENANFVLDAAGVLTPGDAANLSTALESFHLYWLDEPCPPTNLGVARELAERNVTPIGFGRDVVAPGVFQDLLREGAIDVLRPDIVRNGITQIRRMAAIAETYYVVVAPYHGGGPIGTAAALHLAASLPNFFIQQIPLPAAEKDRRMRAELTGKPVELVKDGFAVLPSGAGLGVMVSEEVLDKYKERVL